jgi:hypothetical protein
VTVTKKTNAYVAGRVDHPGVTLEGYFETRNVGLTFIMGPQILDKPRLNAQLAADAKATGSRPPPKGTEPEFAIRVLDAPQGRTIATLTSNQHTFVEVDKTATKGGFRWVVVHTTPVSLLPAVGGPVVSGWIDESLLKDVKARALGKWPMKEQPMPEAGAHGPLSGGKRTLERETLLLAEPNGQVVGAVVSDGVSVTTNGDSDVVWVNNGFGSTFSLFVTGVQVQDKRQSQRGKGAGKSFPKP